MVVKFSRVKVKFDKPKIIRVMNQASDEAIRTVAIKIMDNAKDSLVPHDGTKIVDINGRKIEVPRPSSPGRPPHTKGLLKEAIDFEQSFSGESAIIGPKSEVVSNVGGAHEFGGPFRGRQYPKRPFMGPALDVEVKNNLPKAWENSIRS